MSETNELNQTVLNNEAFISYGKVLSCKDGIIEVAGLHDVMAGEVVKFGDDQMGVILNRVTNTGSFLYVPVGGLKLIKQRLITSLFFITETNPNTAQKLAHDFVYNLCKDNGIVQAWLHDQLVIVISGLVLSVGILIGLYACIKTWPISKNNFTLFKNGYCVGSNFDLNQVKELKEHCINYAKGSKLSKKDGEEESSVSTGGEEVKKPVEEEKKAPVKDNKKPDGVVLPGKKVGQKLTEAEKRLIIKHHKDLKAAWWSGLWWGATITGGAAFVGAVIWGPNVIKDAAKEGAQAGVKEAAPHLIPAAEAGARVLGETVAPHLTPAAEAHAVKLAGELRADVKDGVSSGAKQAIGDEIQKVKSSCTVQ